VKKNYVLIDYENVQPEAMAALERELTKKGVVVVNQSKVSYVLPSGV